MMGLSKMPSPQNRKQFHVFKSIDSWTGFPRSPVLVHGLLGTGSHSRRWAGCRKVKLHLYLRPLAWLTLSHYCYLIIIEINCAVNLVYLNHPDAILHHICGKMFSHENVLPWKCSLHHICGKMFSLLPKRLGTANRKEWDNSRKQE